MENEINDNKEPRTVIHEYDIGGNLGCVLVILALAVLIHTCNQIT